MASERKWRKAVKCSSCDDVFSERRTVFCKYCILESIGTSLEADYNEQLDAVSCPFCRALISEPSLDDIISNCKEKVMQVIKILSKQNEEVADQVFYADDDEVGMAMIGCGKCEENSPAIAWCSACMSTLCWQCDQVHGKWREFRAHKTIPIDEFQKRRRPKQAVAKQPEFCKIHTKQTLDLYCKTCSSFICQDCTLKDHRHHKFVAADRAAAKHKSKTVITKNVEKISKHDHLLSPAGAASSSTEVTSITAAKLPQKQPRYPLCVMKYDYKSVSHAEPDLSFNKEDLIYILKTDKGGWWYVRAKHSGQEGYIPSNYVVECNAPIDKNWYFGAIARKDAEKQLMQPFNAYGSFLIRDSDTRPGNYTLAIRDTKTVKHYKIHKLDDGGFYVTPQVTFENIPKLVDFYSKQAEILCVNLKVPCLPSPAADKLINDDGWEIDKSSIRLVKKLAETSSVNEVWQGMWNNATPVAVKMLKPGTIGAAEFLEEAALMKKLKHPNIIQLYGVCTQGEPVYIVMELMKHGSLLEYLRGDGRFLKLPQLIDMGAQVAAGMAYLVRKHCIHRDLVVSNILVSENLICKVADFGLAQIINDNTREAHKFDVWFFGILLYELITYGCFPYPNAKVLEAFQKGKCIPCNPCPIRCPARLYRIMNECWMDDAASRPTFRILQKQLEKFYSDS